MYVPKAKKLKSGTWYIQLRIAGESIYVTGTTEKDCSRKAALIKAEKAINAAQPSAPELTVREAMERHIAKKERAGRSPETIRGYNVILRSRFQAIMDTPVSSVRSWQRVYDDEAQSVSAKTMRNSWTLLASAIKTECGISLPNVEQIKVTKSEHPFLDPDQIKVFVKAAKGHKYQIPMYLCLCSLRASEARALTWDQVDLKNKYIHVSGAVVYDKNNKPVRKAENKTDGSNRYVPIFIPELYDALCAADHTTEVVCHAGRSSVYRAINQICADNGLPLVGQHGLRHSFASLAYSLGLPIKVTMQLGGWVNYNTIMSIYTHLDQKNIASQSDKIFAFFES